MLHENLKRQLQRLGLNETTLPSTENWQELLGWISSTYANMDRERTAAADSIEAASREAEQLTFKLVEERDKFEGVFKATPSGIAIVNTDGIVIEVNQTIVDMLGYPREDVVGKHVSGFVEQDEAEFVRTRVIDLALARITSSRNHRRLLTKSAEHIVADVQATAVVDDQGHTKMIVVLLEGKRPVLTISRTGSAEGSIAGTRWMSRRRSPKVPQPTAAC